MSKPFALVHKTKGPVIIYQLGGGGGALGNFSGGRVKISFINP